MREPSDRAAKKRLMELSQLNFLSGGVQDHEASNGVIGYVCQHMAASLSRRPAPLRLRPAPPWWWPPRCSGHYAPVTDEHPGQLIRATATEVGRSHTWRGWVMKARNGQFFEAWAHFDDQYNSIAS
jgi:hypothetical protein